MTGRDSPIIEAGRAGKASFHSGTVDGCQAECTNAEPVDLHLRGFVLRGENACLISGAPRRQIDGAHARAARIAVFADVYQPCLTRINAVSE